MEESLGCRARNTAGRLELIPDRTGVPGQPRIWSRLTLRHLVLHLGKACYLSGRSFVTGTRLFSKQRPFQQDQGEGHQRQFKKYQGPGNHKQAYSSHVYILLAGWR